MKNPSQESSYRLKKQQTHKKSVQSSRINPSLNRSIKVDFSSKDNNYRIGEAGVVNTSAVLDLNQAFFPVSISRMQSINHITYWASPYI